MLASSFVIASISFFNSLLFLSFVNYSLSFINAFILLKSPAIFAELDFIFLPMDLYKSGFNYSCSKYSFLNTEIFDRSIFFDISIISVFKKEYLEHG